MAINKGDPEKATELRLAFRKVWLHCKSSRHAEFNIDDEMNALIAGCAINNLLYEQDDFTASCLAYKNILPKIEDLISYIADMMEFRVSGYKVTMSKEKAVAWANGKNPLCVARLEDGSTKQFTNLSYIADYLRKRQMAIAGRYFIHYNIQYLESNRPEKSYPRRMRVLKSAVWWANQMLLGRLGMRMPDTPEKMVVMPRKIIFSTFPSSGKSFLCNTVNEMFSELCMLINKSGGMLRVGNEEGNILRQSAQTMGLLQNPLMLDMYPENRAMVSKTTGKYNPFAKGSEEEWEIQGCEYEPCRSIFKTRDSALNSVRCQFAIMDDPSRGDKECTNISVHTKIVETFNGDFLDRFEDQDNMAVMLTGTMYNPFDVFSTEVQKALEKGYTKDERFDNTFISKDGKTIVILNDCEDSYGRSAYPELISNDALDNKRKSLSPYLYHCVWRQKPIPADGLIFAKEFLKFYDSIDEDHLTSYAFAVIDPTRKSAGDYFSMPIFRRSTISDNYKLCDLIYERKGSRDLLDKVIDKIRRNNIIKLYYEENIDCSYGQLLEERLKSWGIDYCKIERIYSTKKKSEKIVEMADLIKQKIEFPSEQYASTQTVMGFAVRQLMEYSESAKHDDFPDSLAMFAEKFLLPKSKANLIKTERKLPF